MGVLVWEEGGPERDLGANAVQQRQEGGEPDGLGLIGVQVSVSLRLSISVSVSFSFYLSPPLHTPISCSPLFWGKRWRPRPEPCGGPGRGIRRGGPLGAGRAGLKGLGCGTARSDPR